ELSDTWTAANPLRAAAVEIAELQYVGINSAVGGPIPMVNSGKLLMGEFRVRRGFVPAHARNGEVLVSSGIMAHFPCRRPGPARSVVKLLHSLLPGKNAAVFDEFLTPVLPVPISTLVHEFFELPVGDLIPVHPKIIQIDSVAAERSYGRARHMYHFRGNTALGVQKELDCRPLNTSRRVHGPETRFRDAPAKKSHR